MPPYAIVSPVRDEEQYLERTIQSVTSQTVRPALWILVNDGSRDGTAGVLSEYQRRYSWIRVCHRRDRGRRVPGSGVMEAFYEGYQLVDVPWDFIAKLDGDVELPSNYFEKCFERFAADSRLGICGGRMYCRINGSLQLEPHPAFHVRGPIKLYRRTCFEAIGGLVRAPGWDTIDEVQANRLGWRTRSFDDLRVVHQRATGAAQGPWLDGVKMGTAAYICGYHPLFMAAKCVRKLFRPPLGVGALAHGYGFLRGYVKRTARVDDAEFIRYLRRQQVRRLLLQDSIWK